MHPIRQTDRQFGFTVAGVFLLITMMGWGLFGDIPVWAAVICLSVGGLAWLSPGILLPLNRLWMMLAQKIAVVNNTIILGAVFYLFVTPLGIILRIVRPDPLLRRIDKSALSYWTSVKRQGDRESFSDQF